MARKLLKHRTGESLVELIVALALLALALTWVVPAFNFYYKNTTDIDMLSQAAALADAKVELLKTYNLSQLNTALPASGTTSAIFDFNPPNNYKYQYVRITDKSTAGFTLVEVLIKVYYKDDLTNSVYSLKTSFLRDSGGQNAGD